MRHAIFPITMFAQKKLKILVYIVDRYGATYWNMQVRLLGSSTV